MVRLTINALNIKVNEMKIRQWGNISKSLEKIRPYMLEKSGEQKIQLTINNSINVISSKDNDDKQLMYPKSHDIEIMVGKETDGIIREVFQSLFTRYQISMKHR